MRIISFDETSIKHIFELDQQSISQNKNLNENLNFPKDSKKFPPVSSLNGFFEDKKLLVKGDGPINGTIACFQMLANLMNFPFRKNSVEKVLKEFYEENNYISLQVCAEIASYHELQVNFTKIDSNLINRIKTPALTLWKNSFALIINSNQKGIQLASPTEGYITIKTADLKSSLKKILKFFTRKNTNNSK